MLNLKRVRLTVALATSLTSIPRFEGPFKRRKQSLCLGLIACLAFLFGAPVGTAAADTVLADTVERNVGTCSPTGAFRCFVLGIARTGDETIATVDALRPPTPFALVEGPAISTVDGAEAAAGYPAALVTDRVPLGEGDSMFATPAGAVVISDTGDVSVYKSDGSPVTSPAGATTIENAAPLFAPVDAQTAALAGTVMFIVIGPQRGLVRCIAELGKFALNNLNIVGKVLKFRAAYRGAKALIKAKGTRAKYTELKMLFGDVTGANGIDDLFLACT